MFVSIKHSITWNEVFFYTLMFFSIIYELTHQNLVFLTCIQFIFSRMGNEEIFYIIIGILFILANILTIIFSSLTILIFIFNWYLPYRSIPNLISINSNVTFLFLSITFSFQFSYLFHKNVNETNNVSTISCRMRSYIGLVSCIAKVFSYVIQAISRYMSTVLSQHRQSITFREHIIMIIISWLFSIILSSLMLISPIAFQYEVESRLCVLTSKVFHTSLTIIIIGYILPVNIIILLYYLIIRYITRANRSRLNTATIQNNKRNLKVIRNILKLLAVGIIGGAPYFLSIIINRISQTPRSLYSISVLSIVFSALVESATIFFTNDDIKKILSTKICCY